MDSISRQRFTDSGKWERTQSTDSGKWKRNQSTDNGSQIPVNGNGLNQPTTVHSIILRCKRDLLHSSLMASFSIDFVEMDENWLDLFTYSDLCECGCTNTCVMWFIVIFYRNILTKVFYKILKKCERDIPIVESIKQNILIFQNL